MCTNFGRERHENAFSQVVNLVGGSLPKFVHKAKGLLVGKGNRPAGHGSPPRGLSEGATGTRGFTCGVRWLLPGFFRLLPCRPSRSR